MRERAGTFIWFVSTAVLTLGSDLTSVAARVPRPNVNEIVRQSAAVTEADRKASSVFDYSETEHAPDGTSRTYAVHMLYGSPYRELIAVNGKSLSPQDQEQERSKLEHEAARRAQETPGQRAHRIADYERDQARDRHFIEEFTHAFNFKLLGEHVLDGRQVYVIEATPRRDYQQTDRESQVLTGMRGKMWIDKQTNHWVKVEAEVIHPVSIAGFLATVEPGTRFELDKAPVEDGVWLPKHFEMKANAKVLGLFEHTKQQDENYFDYHKASQARP